MKSEYSVKTCGILKKRFTNCNLYRPMSIDRYDEGDILNLTVTSVADNKRSAQVQLLLEKFAGGGFAGQVYRVKIVNITDSYIHGIDKNGTYAMKILIPPSKGSIIFRNVMYWIGFQASFQLQTNPSAARSGAIWQKLIKCGAEHRFQSKKVVNDIHATFVDTTLGSCGELSDWVDGRTWRLEVDEHLDYLYQWKRGKDVDPQLLQSPEYRAKKIFMAEFVKLLHDMGAHEFARQYEWSTWKSQPNCLKRIETDHDPKGGLTAVDFRAGLALLPFLPMSPGDFKLIFQGIKRGSLVQFDRGNLDTLKNYIYGNKEVFEDCIPMIDDLVASENIYRNSVADIGHHHVNLLYNKKLWSTIIKSTITGWKVRNYIDDSFEEKLNKNKHSLLKFFLIFLSFIPILGRILRKFIGRSDWRKHYIKLVTDFSYVKRAVKGKVIEKAITWHRAGRVEKTDALNLPESYFLFFIHVPLSFLPAGIHKFFTNWNYFKERLDYIMIRPFRLYFVSSEREKWFLEMIDEGKKKYIIDDKESEEILSKIKEPFIQKYLKSLAVHVCTVPVTQVVSVIVSWIYVKMHPELSISEATASVAAILILFQITPISPGSLTRGFYVLYLVIKERNFKDYNIAVFLGFFKYIGYLAFPIQMAYRYPILARFMAGHWATEAVHIVPVFGESGALLEHTVFCMFYNWPLTIWRRIRDKTEKRKGMKVRYWHIFVITFLIAGLFGMSEYIFARLNGNYPQLKQMWILFILFPFLGGALTTIGSGGASLWRRIIFSIFFGILTGILYSAISTVMSYSDTFVYIDIVSLSFWRIFIITIFSMIGAIGTELVTK